MVKRLRELKPIDLSLENDFKFLSNKIVSRFPTSYTQNEFYNYFMSKKEQIVSYVQSSNQMVVDSLVNLSHQLLDELKEEIEKGNKIQEQSEKGTLTQLQTSSVKQKNDIQSRVNKAIEICERIQKELDKKFNDEHYREEKSRIAKAYRQVGNLIKELSIGTYNVLLDNILTEKDIIRFINERVPQVEEILQIAPTNAKTEMHTFRKNEIRSGSGFSSIEKNENVSQQVNQDVEKNKSYEEWQVRKNQIVKNFIATTAAAYMPLVDSSYPYTLESADVTPYIDQIKNSYFIPRYPISEEEWKIIITEINNLLQNYAKELIAKDAKERSRLSDSQSSNIPFFLDGFDENKKVYK